MGINLEEMKTFLEALGYEVQPWQEQLLINLPNVGTAGHIDHRTSKMNPFNKVMHWLQMATTMALSNFSGEPTIFTPKDFTPKPTGSVKSSSHYNSKSARKSRQKRGY